MDETSWDDMLGKPEKRTDVILMNIDNMERLAHSREYEMAQSVMKQIQEELKKPATDVFPYSYVPMGDIQTIKDVYDLLGSNSIRLHPKNYKFSEYLRLVIAVHRRVTELQGSSYKDIERKRKVVAEEMMSLGIPIPRKRKGMSRMPNRRFLEVAYNICPSLSCAELQRREEVLLWKAIESGNKYEVDEKRNSISRYSKQE